MNKLSLTITLMMAVMSTSVVGAHATTTRSLQTNPSRYLLQLDTNNSPAGSATVHVDEVRFARIVQRTQRQMSAPTVVYRLSGNAALRPMSVTDDGAKTYIRWGADQPMPATFALGPTGAEQMVEGYVRGGVYTIDRVYAELIFRIDREVARAKRMVERRRHG